MDISMIVRVKGSRLAMWTICTLGAPLLAFVLPSWIILVGPFIYLFTFNGLRISNTECRVVCSWHAIACSTFNAANSASCLLCISCIWPCISLINSMRSHCSLDSPSIIVLIWSWWSPLGCLLIPWASQWAPKCFGCGVEVICSPSCVCPSARLRHRLFFKLFGPIGKLLT